MTEPNLISPPDPEERLPEEALVSFLQTYAPPIPPPDPTAEAQLMQAIAMQPLPHKQPQVWWGRRGWIMGLSLVIVLGVGVEQLSRWLISSPTEELAGMETFFMGNWDASTDMDELDQDWDWVVFSKIPVAVALTLPNPHLLIDSED